MGQAGLAIAAVPYIGITIPFLALVLWMIQRFYLRTSRQLRLLESVSLLVKPQPDIQMPLMEITKS